MDPNGLSATSGTVRLGAGLALFALASAGCLPGAIAPPDGGGGGDMGGQGADLSGPPMVGIPSGLISDPAAAVTVNALAPVYSGTSIVSVNPTVETLPM